MHLRAVVTYPGKRDSSSRRPPPNARSTWLSSIGAYGGRRYGTRACLLHKGSSWVRVDLPGPTTRIVRREHRYSAQHHRQCFTARLSTLPVHRKHTRYSLTKGIPKTCVDELIHALAQVAEQHLVRCRFLDRQCPTQISPAATGRQVETDDGVGSLGSDRRPDHESWFIAFFDVRSHLVLQQTQPRPDPWALGFSERLEHDGRRCGWFFFLLPTSIMIGTADPSTNSDPAGRYARLGRYLSCRFPIDLRIVQLE